MLSMLTMLNHNTEAQALCCWLELEMMTTGSDEAYRVTAASSQKIKDDTEVINQRCNADLQGHIQAFVLEHCAKVDDVQLLCDTEGNLSTHTHTNVQRIIDSRFSSRVNRLSSCVSLLTSPLPFPPAPHFCSFRVWNKSEPHC